MRVNTEVNAEIFFLPERRRGMLYQVAVMVLLAILGVLGLWQASQAVLGPSFVFSLLPLLIAFVGLPLLAYRVYALQTAYYAVQREGVRLRWGLRQEEIPISAILWVRPGEALKERLLFPWLRWPGALLGARPAPGLGNVEFMASGTRGLVCIGTVERIFAISPRDPAIFIQQFHRLTELGSLSPIPARTVYPGLLLRNVWASRPARLLLIAGFLLSLGLLVWSSLAIPSRVEVHMGFEPDGSPGDLVPVVQLLLLPVLNSVFFVTDLFLGLFFFRRESSQSLAYLAWGMGAVLPLLFATGLFFILNTG
jgi:Bacterial PH domain